MSPEEFRQRKVCDFDRGFDRSEEDFEWVRRVREELAHSLDELIVQAHALSDALQEER